VNEQPNQIIHPAKALPLTVVDLGNYPAENHANVARRLAAGERNQPFDLSCGPLLRVSLARLGKDEHLLSLTMHHIISDGWSRGVLSRELSALYRAFVEGMPSPLAELPIQYADYAIWQRRWLQGQVLEQQLAYWKQQLEDPSVMELPMDWPRPPLQNFHGAAQSLVLSEALSDALRSLSQREGVTLFMTLLAAFQLLLGRLSGQNDILVGTPVAGRSRIETEGLIGFFISTLVLRTDLSGNPSFKKLLSRVNQVALGAYAHQELPFEKLVEELQPKRSLSRNPIFDVLINFNNAPQQLELQLPGISVEPLPETAEPESQFAMTLYIHDDGRQLNLRMVYQSALFSVPRIVHFLSQLEHLFEQIVAAPEQPIGACSLVTPAMRPLLPDPSEPIPEPQYVLTTRAIADWARRAPMSPAVHEDDQVWSYGELWDVAQAIARALRDHGVRRSDVVAISGVKSFGLIAAMTGTLSSGGVMLTLDRNFPAERQKLLVREVGVAH
ncbi:MAG: condensation domain-containing protein, partial [Burkholderiales bacterium]